MLPWVLIYLMYVEFVVSLLDPPDGLRAEVTSSNTFHVTWDNHPRDNDKDTTYYTLRYRPEDLDYYYIETQTTEADISNTIPNTTYQFTVKFHKGRRSSSWSIPAYNQTSDIIDVPSAPRFLRIRHLSPGHIKIKWRKPKLGYEEIIGYRLTWRERGNSSINTVDLPDRSYLVTSMNPGKTYDISVVAIGNKRMSKANKISFITPTRFVMSPPTNLTIDTIGTTKLRVRWGVPKKKNRAITSYKIQYRRKGVRRGDLCSVTTHSRRKEYIITDLIRGEFYKIRIAAKTNDGTGTFSKWRVAQTKENKRAKDKVTTSSTTPSPTTTLYGVTTGLPTTTEVTIEEPYWIDVSIQIEPMKGGFNITWSDLQRDDITVTIIVEKDGDEFEPQNKIVIGNSAIIQGLDSDTLYYVTANFEASGAILTSMEDTVVPLNPLRIEGIKNVHAFSRSNTSLTCMATNTDADTRIVWMVGDADDPFPDGSWFIQSRELNFQIESLETENSNILSTLTIPRVSKDDAGTYHCKAIEGVIKSEGYVHLNVTDPIPGPVTELTAEPMSPYKVHLIWSSPDGMLDHYIGNVTYKIIYSRDGERKISLSGIKDSHYMLNNLEPSSSYQVMVIAENEYGNSGNGVNKNVTVNTPPVLGPPRVISVKTINSSVIVIEWEAPQYSEVLEYRVKYKTKTNTTSLSISVDKMDRIAFLNDLESRQNYDIRVEAVTAERVLVSSWQGGSTYPDAYLDESRLPPPPADVFLDVVNTTLYISWLPPHYEYKTLVRWYEAEVFVDGNFLTRSIVDEQSKEIIIENIDPIQDHIVYVRALNKIGQSDPIRRVYQPVYDYADSMVNNLRAMPIDSTSVLVNWSPPTRSRLTRYLIRYLPLGIYFAKPTDEWLAPSHNNYVLMHLNPYQDYKISVIPYINDIEGNVSSVNVRTYSSFPTSPPENFTATVINDTNVLLTWLPPPETNQNGELVGYSIQYQSVDKTIIKDITTNASSYSHMVKGLEDGIVYVFRISAMTSNGTGPWSNWIPIKIDFIIKEPPSVPTNFTAEPARLGIRLSWIRPPEQDIPLKGYIVGYGRFLPEVYRRIVGRNKVGVTLRRLRPKTEYIVSVRAFNAFGESKAVILVARSGSKSSRRKEITTTTLAPKVIDDRPIGVTVKSVSLEVVMLQVSWQPPIRPKGQIRGYLVYYKDDRSNDTDSWDVKFDRSLSYTINNLQFNTTYLVRVQVQYEDDIYGGITDVIKHTTPILDTTKNVLPKPEISSVFSGRNYLQITWMPPDAEYIHVVRGYILGYGTQEAGEHQEIIPISQKSFQIENLVPGTKYYLSLRVFNDIGESEKLLFSASTADD